MVQFRILSAARRFAPFAFLLLAFSAPVFADVPAVNIANRTAVSDFYHNYYCPSDKVMPAWTGDVAAGNAGTTSAAYAAAALERINFFRAMAGVSSGITLRDDWNAKCRQAALMMSAAGQLNHFPPASWQFYSTDGAEAAGKSDLSLGTAGPDAVTDLMRDDGDNNAAAGHRRWLLYPVSTEMGFGSVIPKVQFLPATAVWVFQENPDNSVPRDFGVPWPPAGFVPFPLVFPRWSFSYPSADFSAASVAVTMNGAPVPVTLELSSVGTGDNAIVWKLTDANAGKGGPDVMYHVTVSNVGIGGSPHEFSYDVTQIDAELPLKQSKVQVTLGVFDKAAQRQDMIAHAVNKLGCTQFKATKLQVLWASPLAHSTFKVIATFAGNTVDVVLSSPGRYKIRIKGTTIDSKVYEFKKGRGLVASK
jgi:hypothetical protein